MNRKIIFIAILSCFCLCSLPCAANSPHTLPVCDRVERSGEVVVKIQFVVLDDLNPKPVPFTDFRAVSESDENISQVIRTDEKGTAIWKLAPGKYRIESVAPLMYKGRSLTWSKAILVEPGKPLSLTLTDADTLTTATVATPSRKISEEAEVYQRLKTGVVTVESETGSGSGFVVDERGLILTNQHVVEGSHWFAVRFRPGIRLNAVVVDQDPHSDVAVLRFDAATFKDFTLVPLADTSKEPVCVEGERVLAIGSPLHQQNVVTRGIISKVENDVLISDVNINHGNSGGPLLNLAGEAIGITTFGDFSRVSGPGISGIVAIQKAVPILERVKSRFADLSRPVTGFLPDISQIAIPPNALERAAQFDIRLEELNGLHDFRGEIYTPFVIASWEGREDRLAAKNKGRTVHGTVESEATPRRFYESFADNIAAPVVYIQLVPEYKETSGSKQRGALAGIGSVIVGRKINRQSSYEFSADFYDMELQVDEDDVVPLRRGRIKMKSLFVNAESKILDRSFLGVYQFDPAVFEPGHKLVLRYRRSDKLDKWMECKIDPKVQQRIWDQFSSYREALKESPGDR